MRKSGGPQKDNRQAGQFKGWEILKLYKYFNYLILVPLTFSWLLNCRHFVLDRGVARSKETPMPDLKPEAPRDRRRQTFLRLLAAGEPVITAADGRCLSALPTELVWISPAT